MPVPVPVLFDLILRFEVLRGTWPLRLGLEPEYLPTLLPCNLKECVEIGFIPILYLGHYPRDLQGMRVDHTVPTLYLIKYPVITLLNSARGAQHISVPLFCKDICT